MNSHARRLSLEQKLPLLISGLLVLVLVATSWVAYRDVERSAMLAATERLQRVARELAGLIQVQTTARFETMGRIAADPALRAWLRAPTMHSRAPADSALGRLRVAADTAAVTEVWSARAEPLASDGRPISAASRARGRAVVSGSSRDIALIGALYTEGDSVFYWVVAPVSDRGATAGWLAQRRRMLTAPRAQEQVRNLIGTDVTIYFSSSDPAADLWVDLGGRAVQRVVGTPDSSVLFRYERPRGVTHIAAANPVAGTSWVLIAERPLSAVQERPRAFLRRMTLLALIIVLLGGGAAWLVSRHVTVPLARLNAAAEAVAGGDYSRRVDIRRGDELGRVADTFNMMAGRVERARADLESQIDASRALTAELEKANRAKADFLAVMSHELRTPLNAIGGYVDLIDLGLRGSVTEQQRQDLQRIRRNQQHLLGIITNILTYARADARHIQFEMGAVALDPLLEDTAVLIESQVRTKDVHFERVPCTSDVEAWADPDWLRQIILNLLSNAVRFTQSGGRVTVDCVEDGGGGGSDGVRITVADTGPGIPTDKLEEIFEPFVQLDRRLSRPTEGIGLGLAISRELARAMGGDVTVVSAPGRGSTFTVTLARADGRRTPAFGTGIPATGAR
ncbi:MAG: HAMP domain-containing histidine kinase [Gemmatimonadota bacterium]|nr:HAMP domain-containing histidine kinase [Gemmatimonadota bacterium]